VVVGFSGPVGMLNSPHVQMAESSSKKDIFILGLPRTPIWRRYCYKAANYDGLVKRVGAHKWPKRLSKADEIVRDFSIEEEKVVNGFIAKLSPFLIGILTTLLTLFSLIRYKSLTFSRRRRIIVQQFSIRLLIDNIRW
jgi:hypothetical protein